MPFLLTAFGFARGFIAKLSPSQLIIAALVMLAVFQHFHAVRLEHHAASLSAALGKERSAHAADIARWKAASEAATKLNTATIRRVETAQAAITKGVSDDYQTNLAALRTSYGRLRNQAANNKRPADGDRASPVCNAPSPVDGQAVPLSSDDRLTAAETELQLNALIDWTRKQATIDPNAKP